MLQNRWALGAALAVAVIWECRADATVVAAIPLNDLVSMSEWVVVAEAKSARSHYETIGGSRRMVTDTTLEVTSAVTPNRSSRDVESKTIVVRTLGGNVGDLAQVVLGEAVFPHGVSQLLFLDEGSDHRFRVAAMAQGQYPIVAGADGTRRLRPSSGLDVIVNPQQSAVSALAGKTVEQAQQLVQAVHQSVRRVP
jgi:hypothetical protein